MSAPRQCEILVVGSGPAGATVARQLAQAGRDVLLIEKETLPRHKPCAGGVPDRTLARLDLDVTPVLDQRVTSVALDGAWTGRQLYTGGAWVVRRAVFDHFLTKAAMDAGASLLAPCRLEGMDRTPSGFMARTSTGFLQARLCCIADGVFSPTAKALGFPRNSTGFCLEGIVPHHPNLTDDERGRAVFNLTAIKGGYAWSFPRADAFAVGIGGAYPHDPGLRPRLERFLRRTPELRGGVLQETFGGMIPDYLRRPSYVEDGAYLLGDAAGLTDPLTGEGIFYAIASGLHAAEAILHDTPALYPTRLAEDLLPELDLASRASRILRVRSPWLFALAMCLPAFRRRAQGFVDLLNGRSSYQSLFGHGRAN